MKTTCEICPHHCRLDIGQTGLCGARTNLEGRVACTNYGRLTSVALDPIEKKPLARFQPGGTVLSVGSYGCNLRCPFCQNYSISMADGQRAMTTDMPPEELVRQAVSLRERGNIGIAYTYNEPLVGYEYVRDCGNLAHEHGLKNVVVSNGYICREPLERLLPVIDAMNVDLKGFTDAFYRKLGGDLETVKQTIVLASKHCHLEVTTLIVPGENDSPEEMERLSEWLSTVSVEIPLHISRFFPIYRYADKSATPVYDIYNLADVAKKHLQYVYTGNC